MIEEKLQRICFAIIALSITFMVGVYIFAAESLHRDLSYAVGFSIGSAFLSTCAVILIFDVWLGKEMREKRERLASEAISVSVRRALGFRAHGVIGIHDGFNIDRFCAAAKKSKNIFILQTYAPNMQAIRPAMLDVLNRDGEVKLAILDPDSDFVKIRAAETPELHIGDPLVAFKSNIVHDSTARFMQVAKLKKAGTASLRNYDRSPGVCIYATDSMMLVGPYLTNTDAVNAPMVEIEGNTEAYQKFLEHFNSIWDDAKIKEI
jgi:hypothetical protein